MKIMTIFMHHSHLLHNTGTEYDYFGIGELVFCQSQDNDFGVHTRFFKYSQASLIGAMAIKAGESVVTITTPGTTADDLPNLRFVTFSRVF